MSNEMSEPSECPQRMTCSTHLTRDKQHHAQHPRGGGQAKRQRRGGPCLADKVGMVQAPRGVDLVDARDHTLLDGAPVVRLLVVEHVGDDFIGELADERRRGQRDARERARRLARLPIASHRSVPCHGQDLHARDRIGSDLHARGRRRREGGPRLGAGRRHGSDGGLRGEPTKLVAAVFDAAEAEDCERARSAEASALSAGCSLFRRPQGQGWAAGSPLSPLLQSASPMPCTRSTSADGSTRSTRSSSSVSAGRLGPCQPRATEHDEKSGGAPSHVEVVERISACTPPLPSLLSATVNRPSATTTPVDGAAEVVAVAAAALAAAAAEASTPLTAVDTSPPLPL